MWWFEQVSSSFRDFNLTTINIDEALLNISSSFDGPVWLYILSDDCHSCAYMRFDEKPILPDQPYTAIANVRHGSTIRFRTAGNSSYASATDDSLKLCDLRGDFGEFGVYSIHIPKHIDITSNEFTGNKCISKTELEPVDIYSPILFVFMFWIIVAVLCSLVIKHWTTISMKASSVFRKLISFQFTRQEELRVRLNENEAEQSSTHSAIDEPFVAPSPSTSNVTRKRTKKQVRGQKHDSSGSKPPLTSHDDNDNAQRKLLITTPVGSSSNSLRNTNAVEWKHRPQKERLKSLDAFRGLCILIMIFVDDGGGGYYFFQHSTWDGLYVADLAFPWFLWICGVCIPFSIHSKLRADFSKRTVLGEVLKRSLKLVILGIMVNTSTRSTAVHLENLRLPGVLQRFGVCYFVGSVLFLLYCNDDSNQERTIPRTGAGTTTTLNLREHNSSTWRYHFKDINMTFIPWIFVSFCSVFHIVVLFTMPVPGCPTGYLGPAGLHKNSSYPSSCVGGATGYVDRLVFGINHIHNRPTSQKVYGSGAFDPEGIFGILPSILHVWIGVQAGTILLVYKTTRARVCRFALWSAVFGIAGVILCGGFQNQGYIPINKNLWSLSFVCVTSSAAFLLLAAFYVLIDVQKYWSGRPLMDAGMNSILLYLGHEMCHAMVPWHFAYGSMRTHVSNLIESSWGTFLWVLIAIYTHERKILTFIEKWMATPKIYWDIGRYGLGHGVSCV